MKRENFFAFTVACIFSGCSVHVMADTLLFSGATGGTAFVDSGPLKNNIVDFSWVGDRAIYQGDIILNISKPGSVISQNSVVTTRTGAGWTNALVPFVIGAGVDRTKVLQAIAHWQQLTAFKFVERATDFIGDSIVFTSKANVCQSMVGRVGGQQPIELGSGCTKGHIIHEIGHAIGFLHEQSRNDRDQYVRILYENINPAMHHNFDIYADSEDVGTYDFASIMHYPLNAFSMNGLNTIV